MRRRILVAGLALLALPATTLAATLEVRPADHGRTFCLRGGDLVRIALPENPSTGFAWRYTVPPNGAVLRRVSSRYVADPQSPGTVGGGGTRTFGLRVLRAGRTSLTLKLIGPGQPLTRPAQRFRLSVGC